MSVSKKNLVYLVNTLGTGGTEKAVELVAKKLATKYTVTVIAIQSGGIREKYLRDAGIQTLVLHKDLSKLALFFQSHPVDIVHIHYLVIPLKILGSASIILHHHFSQPLYTKDEYDMFAGVVFNSQRTRQKFYELTGFSFNSKRDVVIYSPVETALLAKTAERIPQKYIEQKKRELGISPTDIVIGRLGRPDIVKWSDTLIYALPFLIRDIPHLKVILQSVPRSRTWILQHSPWKDHLILNPPTDPNYEVAFFYRLIDIYTHASKIGESFGLTLAEAGACQKPVVVTSTPDADNAQIEVVDHQKTGLIVDSPITFARAIAWLAKEKKTASKLGIQAKRKVLVSYDVKKIASELDALYMGKMNAKENAKNFSFWKKEYQKRLRNVTKVQLSFWEKSYLFFIKLLTYGTRVSDVLEHNLNV